MEYRFIPSSHYNRDTREATLYIIPLSAEEGNYGIIYPRHLRRKLKDPGYLEQLKIRHFRGCPGEAVEEVRRNLGRWLKAELERQSRVLENTRLVGIGLLLVGLINVVFPDPLVLLDEVLMLGGAMILLNHWRSAGRELQRLKQQEQAWQKQIRQLPVSEDAVCTALWESIRTRQAGSGEELPAGEAEAAWMEKFLRIEEILQADPVRLADVRNIYQGVSSAVPLKRCHRLEQKIRRAMRRGRGLHNLVKRQQRLNHKISRRSGFSEDGLIVYRALAGTLEEFEE